MFENFFKSPKDHPNITPKILAIIMAIVLWLYVMNEQNPPIESTFTIPLEVRNAATSLVITDAPETVRIKVRGPRSIVAGVLTQDIKAFVDVKGLSEGRHNVKVAAAVPSSLELTEINPDKVQLRLDTTISRQVPVEVRLSGAPAKGAIVGKVAAATEHVTIEGPKNVLGAVDKVIASVDLSGKGADFTATVPLIPVNREGREVEGVTIYPEKTNLAVSLTVETAKRVVDVKLVTQGKLKEGLAIKSIVAQPDKIEIRETAAGKGFDKIDAIYTEPINITDVDKDIEQEVKLQQLEGVTAITDRIKVHITIGPR